MSLEEALREWESTVPIELTSDALWHSTAYRLATFASDTIWPDLSRLEADARTKGIASQLAAAVGSIGANYAEAYSRASGRDRSRIYEYALGSAREARDWTYKARHVLGADRTAFLLELLTRIVRLLTVTVVRERNRDLDERRKVASPARRRRATKPEASEA